MLENTAVERNSPYVRNAAKAEMCQVCEYTEDAWSGLGVGKHAGLGMGQECEIAEEAGIFQVLGNADSPWRVQVSETIVQVFEH